ncbi:hypothetical protein POJ06DRAFT_45267 [Lipomyces tetrasporus]|uniref:Probable metalloprotease ARX1 n=1 Tax=Lipomyces tetrasporus TaxID=54092 RepID=A0AAD7QKC2_9ASCO|nr:uncharacterized protein POJ06DRAFT_45267 [Lipomyces tetrasporus]KAJ8096853.1 hypothetical protein POJ06DRAFT_45267 [Lipomyces tetrasporus]
MSLQEIVVDGEETVDTKNALTSLDSPISLKYVAAGRIAQSVLSYLVREIAQRRMTNVYDICHTGDSLIEQETSKIYKNVDEKGIAGPTTVDINNCVQGYSPVNRETAYVLSNGDIVKISLGVHVDGYTSLVSHTLIALPTIAPIDQVAPTTGILADDICATHLATEAVMSLLGTVLYRYENPSGYYGNRPVNGERIRDLVESIAKTFQVKVVPGSAVRRVKRFLVGQDTVHEVDVKGYAWGSISIEAMTDDPDEGDLKKMIDTEAAAEPGEAWLVDIIMCPFSGPESGLNKKNPLQVSRRMLKPHGDLKPTIFTRDYNRNLSMKLKSARGVLIEVDNRKSVYPFHMNNLSTPGAPLGVAALANADIVAPTKVMMIQGSPSPIATRVRTTVLLMPSAKHVGEVVRLSGGGIKPSWVHSEFEVTDEDIMELLSEKRAGVRLRNIQGSDLDVVRESGAANVQEMEVE